MEAGDILTEMSACDFSTPLTVTIMYEDSDEELQTEKKIALHENSLPKIYDDEDNCKPCIQEYSSRFNDKKKCAKGNNNYGDDNDNHPKKPKIHNEYAIKNKTQFDESHQSNKCCIEKSASDVLKTVPRVENKQCNGSDIQEKTKKKSFDELDKFLNGLLVKVSESLIHILDAYHSHVKNVLNRTNDVTFVQESKKRYVRIRNHFFQLCYCTTVTIILSKENDATFTEDFLKKTVTLADKKNITVTEQEIKPFFYEMILWAKQRNNFHNLPEKPRIDNTKSDITDTLLRRQLSQPPLLPLFQSSLAKSRPVVCHYSTDTDNTDREIKITALNDQHKPVLLYSKILPPVSNLRTEPPVSNILRRQRIPAHHYTNQIEDNYGPASQPMSHFVTTNTLRDRNHLKRPYDAYKDMPIDMPNPMDDRFFPTYDETLQWKKHSMVSRYSESVRENAYHTYQNCNINTSHSSVSTDSGFTSPYSHSPVDSTVSQETTNAHVTPLITHITSLNPKALQMVEGSCYICGAPTKKKCVGCYQIYYCSYECQKSDWNKHMMFCIQVTKSHKN